MLIKEKQGISVMTAVLMLLILVVVLVGSFGNWFNFFTSDVSSDLSQSIDSKTSNYEISSIIDNKLYLYSELNSNNSITEFKMNNQSCSSTSNSIGPGVNSIDMNECIITTDYIGQNIEFVIVTNERVISKNFYVENFTCPSDGTTCLGMKSLVCTIGGWICVDNSEEASEY